MVWFGSARLEACFGLVVVAGIKFWAATEVKSWHLFLRENDDAYRNVPFTIHCHDTRKLT
jgi:hypothetical protein